MSRAKRAGAFGPRLQYVSANWITEAKFEPSAAGQQMNLKEATVVGQVLIAKRWYELWLQLAGPIPLVWVESKIDGQRAWLTDMAKKKLDQLLAPAPQPQQARSSRNEHE